MSEKIIFIFYNNFFRKRKPYIIQTGLWYLYNTCGVLQSIYLKSVGKKTIYLRHIHFETDISPQSGSKSGLPPGSYCLV